MKRNVGFLLASGAILCITLLSFSTMPGAHSVQVYFDSKLVIDHYIHTEAKAPKLVVDPSEGYSQVIVKYNECGRTVTGRVLTIKDENNKVLKDWRFEGATAGFKDPMPISAKEILSLSKNSGKNLKLYYSSNEFQEGQQIAFLAVENSSSTAAVDGE